MESIHRDIFISYSNRNKTNVDKVVTALKSFGATLWYQARDSKQDFLREINRGIKNSSAFVVFLTEESIDSIMVRNEINRAISEMSVRPYKILPVVLKEIDEEHEEMIKLLIGSFNWIDFRDYNDDFDLALSIIEQIGLKIEQQNSENSKYSGTSEAETKRIKSQNALINGFVKPCLDEIFEKLSSPNVLDIGCSDGENVLLRLAGREYSTLLGIDKDEQKLALANLKHKNDKNTFMAADITAPSLEDVLKNYLAEKGIAGFDLIHISAVLLHIKNPEGLLQILYGVLSDGGYIFIQDEDDGMNIAYPHYPFFDNCFYIWQHSLESGDRKMGRKIPGYLAKTGYRDISLKRTAISSVDAEGDMKEALWDLYFNPYLWDATKAEYFDNYEAFDMLKGYFAEHDNMKSQYLNGDIFITLGFFFITARK